MKPTDIEVGRVYHDGKLGLRRVVDEGEHCNQYGAPPGTDCVAYETLHARMRAPSYHKAATTRANFGTWAKARVPKEREEEALEILRAQSLEKTLSAAQRALLMRLDEAQAGKPHAQLMTAREVRTAQDLIAKNVLMSPSGSAYARLAPLGERLVRQLKGETFTVPTEAPAVVPKARARSRAKP